MSEFYQFILSSYWLCFGVAISIIVCSYAGVIMICESVKWIANRSGRKCDRCQGGGIIYWIDNSYVGMQDKDSNYAEGGMVCSKCQGTGRVY